MDERIRQAFGEIHAEPELLEQSRSRVLRQMQQTAPCRKRLRRWRPALAAAAATMVGVVAGMWLYFTPTTAISLELPSVLEMEINRFDRVVSVEAETAEGAALVQQLSLLHRDYHWALEQLLRHPSVQQCLAEEPVAVSVVEGDMTQAAAVYEELCHYAAQGENLHCQMLSGSAAQEADTWGMSYGQYQAYQELLEVAPSVLPEEVLDLSAGEIRRWAKELGQATKEEETGEPEMGGGTAGAVQEQGTAGNGGHGNGQRHQWGKP